MKIEGGKILIAVIGPTAVGKTQMAIDLANEFKTEIISADSRQFFKELSIGTAKPTVEEQAQAKHHFINNLSIQEDYNASRFEKEVLQFLETFYQEHSTIILCGGSGMYVNALIDGFDDKLPPANTKIREELNDRLRTKGIADLQEELKELDPEFYQEIDLNNSKRLMRAIEICRLSDQPYSELRKGKKKEREFEVIKIGLEMDREDLYDRINKRVDLMIEEGLEEEARSVLEFRNHNALKTVGYSELFKYFDGNMSFEEAVEKIKVNSRRYAKRQLTWFKKDNAIKWFPPDQKKEIIQYIRNRIEQSR